MVLSTLRNLPARSHLISLFGKPRLSLVARRIRVTLAFALLPLVAISTPLPAIASSTPNFTFTVKGFDGALLAGATVGVNYDLNGVYKYESATSQANGVAEFLLPVGATDLHYFANPPANDTQNALIFTDRWMGATFQLSDQSREIKFGKSDLRLVVMANDGVTQVESAWLFLRSSFKGGSFPILRPGPINLSLQDIYSKGITLQSIQIWRNRLDDSNLTGDELNDFPWTFGVSRDANGIFRVYTDVKKSTEVPKLGSASILKFAAPNIKVKLKNADGTDYRFPGYETQGATAVASGSLQVYLVNEAGESIVDGSNPGEESYSQPKLSGEAMALIGGGRAGRYVVQYENDGTWTFPTMRKYIYMDSAGAISQTPSGPYLNRAIHEIDFTIDPSRIFKYKNLDEEGGLVAGSISFSGKSQGEKFWTYTNSGRGLIQLPSDIYDLTVHPDGGAPYSFVLDFRTSAITLTSSAGSVIAVGQSDSAYPFAPPASNVKFRAVDESDSNTSFSAHFSVYKFVGDEDQYVAGNSTGNFYLPDGTNYFLGVYPNEESEEATFQSRQIPFRVVNGMAQIDSVTAIEGIHRIPMKRPNFKFALINPIDSSSISGWVLACLSSTGKEKRKCVGGGANATSGGAIFLSDGTYEVFAEPEGNTSLSRKSFQVTVAQGLVTSSQFSTVAGKLQIIFDRPNISGYFHSAITDTRVVLGDAGTPYGLSVQLQRLGEGNNWEWTKYSSWNSSSRFGFSIAEAGQYRILVEPYGSDDLVRSVSQSFWVNQSLNVATTQNGVYGSSIDNFVVKVETPNVTLRVVNDENGSPLPNSYMQIYESSASGMTYLSHINQSQVTPALFKVRLADGSYEVQVSPPSDDEGGAPAEGLVRQNFNLTVSNGVASATLGSQAMIRDTSSAVVLRMPKGNLRGTVVDLAGRPAVCNDPSSDSKSGRWRYVNLQLQQLVADKGSSWQYSRWIGMNCSTAKFSEQINAPGTYRILLEPQDFREESTSYSDSFVVTETSIATRQVIDLGNVSLGRPSIRIAVTPNSPDSRLTNASIYVYSDEGGFYASTGSLGVASLTFPKAGEYTLEVHPSWEARNQGSTRSRYTAVASQDSNGRITAVITPGTGVTMVPSESLTVLRLGIPNLKGTVHAPDSQAAIIRSSQVIPIESGSQRELWDYSTSTDDFGRWSMSLPEGRYELVAKTPWGSADYGNSARIGIVSVDSLGAVTLSGAAADSRTALAFNIPLSLPRWKGQVFEPTVGGVQSQVPIQYPWLCLMTNDRWTCTSGDRNGRWAITPDFEFSDFSTNSYLEVFDRYGRFPLLRYRGKDAVSTALGGVTNQSVRLNMRSTNVEVVVRAGGTLVENAWVSIDRSRFGGEYLGSSSTGATGIAKFVLDSLTESITVHVDPSGQGDFGLDYVRTVRTVSGTSGETLTVEISLDSPNFRGVVREPNDNPSLGAAAANSWINAYEQSKGVWGGGASTDSLGRFAMNFERPSDGTTTYEYTLTAYPSWQTTSDVTFSRYTVVVPATGAISIYPKGQINSIVPVETITGRTHYTISLGEPSVTGIVVAPDSSPVTDSYVLPIESEQKRWYWENGQNSRAEGKFNLSLPDGTYFIQAKRPWHLRELADSQLCPVTITNQQVSNHGASCEDGTSSTTKIRLTLREPNVKFRLVDSTNQPVRDAYVGIGFGNWHTWSYSGETGTVSAYIDSDAIALLNPWYTETNIAFHIWVNPPWGSSAIDMVSWSCRSDDDTKPICAQLPDVTRGIAYPQANYGDIQVLGSNTRIKVTKPATGESATAYTWVHVYELVDGCTGCQNWVGGSYVTSSGEAKFRLSEDANKRFGVGVWPSWEDRNDFAHKIHDNNGLGYTRAQLNSLSFSLGAPNLFLRVFAPGGLLPSKYAYVSIDIVDSETTQLINGYRGMQLDQNGRGGVLLDPSKTYRISIYPGNGQVGSTTQCIVRTDVAGNVTADSSKCWGATVSSTTLQLNLSSGNVRGTVKNSSGQTLPGVIVYANYQETLTSSVVATSDSSGVFGLELGSDKNWTITFIPLTTDGSVSPYLTDTRSVTSAEIQAAQSASPPTQINLGDISLATRP